MTKQIFENTKHAFIIKSDKELKKSIFIYRMMSRPWLVAVGSKLTKLGFNIGLPIKGLVKNTIFQQFCGGETKEDCVPVLKEMHDKNVFSVFDFASEIREKEEKDLEADIKEQMELINFATTIKQVPFVAIKPSQIGNISTWQKVNEGQKLTAEDQKKWEGIQRRMDQICKHVSATRLSLMVDAEESWVQDAVDELVDDMMEKYNKKRPVVFGTVQCYRKDRLTYMKRLHQRGKEKNFCVGMKIVRGAYLEKENNRAKKKGYPTPIWETKEKTDKHYNEVVKYCLENVNNIAIYIGTHNEESTYKAMEIMEKNNIPKDEEYVWFSQLYGMSDHISFNLGYEKYNVAKYLPFGKVDEVVPYLIRRAEENSSVKGQTGRELSLLLAEKKRRKRE